MDDWMHAADSHGVVNLGDLRSAGLHRRDVVELTRRGDLTALARGWYAVGPVESDTERHVLTTRAMVRSHGGRAVAGHHSALLVLALPTLGADLGVVRLSRRHSGPTRSTQSVRLGRAVPSRMTTGDTVTPSLAVVQHGTSAGPLAALVAADDALRAGVATRAELADAADFTRGHPHSAGIADILRHADGRHESPGETRLAHVLRLLDIAATPQVRIEAPGFIAVVDFLVDGTRLVIEFDGRVKYGRTSDEVDPFGRRRSGEQVLWDEKRREDRLRELGYQVIRVTWSDLDSPKALGERLRRAVERARSLSA